MECVGESDSIRVLCIDDNDLVAAALAVKLQAQPNIVWLGHRPSADSLIADVRVLQPHIVLLDLDMPGQDPLAAMKSAVDAGLTARMVVLSGHVSLELIDRAIAAGAWGYVSKSDGDSAVLDAIRKVASGEFALSAEATLRLNSRG